MARIPYIEPDKHPELNDLITKIRGQRGGELSHLYGLLLYSSPLAAGWLKIVTAIRKESTVSLADQELVIMLVAVLNKAGFEYKNHAPQALKLGFTQAQFDAIPTWRDSKVFDQRQRTILEYTETMTREVEVPDALFEAVRKLFDTRAMVELTALISIYNMVTRFTVGMKLG